jgi:aminomethyltransferase
MKHTPLYDRHQALGGKIIDFGGWAMPVQYSGILDEHKAVREAAGIFDVSHMGEIQFDGPRAGEAIQRLVTNDVSQMHDGAAMYACACLPTGGIVDDLIVYRDHAESYLIVVNAANIDKDFAWFKEQVGSLCAIENWSDRYGLLAVQGPRAVALVQSISQEPIAALKSFTWTRATVGGVDVEVARTGYTGEDGVEIFVPSQHAVKLWDALFSAGGAFGLKPIGLGARDTLRLEAKLSLYGNDIDAEHTPVEAGLSRFVKGKGFIGEEVLARQKAEGVTRKLVGFVMKERGTARHGYCIVADDGQPVGLVTSGSFGPTVGVNVGLGYVPVSLAAPGTRLTIDCRGKKVAAEVVSGPFYKRRS